MINVDNLIFIQESHNTHIYIYIFIYQTPIPMITMSPTIIAKHVMSAVLEQNEGI